MGLGFFIVVDVDVEVEREAQVGCSCGGGDAVEVGDQVLRGGGEEGGVGFAGGGVVFWGEEREGEEGGEVGEGVGCEAVGFVSGAVGWGKSRGGWEGGVRCYICSIFWICEVGI